MSKNNYAIEVSGVKKSFFLPHHKNDSLKTAITQAFKRKEKGGNTFNALNGVSFKVEKGDFFGILGRNGSGKSTLLKIISEIYQPSSGSVKHNGKLVSFIELGVGFKAELTGRENVFLNGALLGFSRKEVEEMYEDIVSFAELEQFMDQKLKNYSSGMKVRLAFSVAIRAKADILILDEVLAVGDAAFQKKCTDYFETLKNDGKTVVLVTHSMGNVRRFCNKAIVIDDGLVRFEGGAEGAASEYLKLFGNSSDTKVHEGNRRVNVSDVSIGVDKELINMSYTLESLEKISDVRIGIDICKNNGDIITGVPGAYFNAHPFTVDQKHKGRAVFLNRLFDGDYYVNIKVQSITTKEVFAQVRKAATFHISDSGMKSALSTNLFLEEESSL